MGRQIPNFLKKPSTIAIIFGAIMVIIGAWIYTVNFLYEHAGKETLAIVTSSNLGGGQVTYYQFMLPDGRVKKGVQNRVTRQAGSQILIEYVPKFPSLNRISNLNSKEKYFILPVIIMGAFFMFVGIKSKSREGYSNPVQNQ